jgi:hypothetical protein
MSKQREQTDGSPSLTASGTSPPHVITLRRGDGVVIRYEYPESVLQASRAARSPSKQ